MLQQEDIWRQVENTKSWDTLLYRNITEIKHKSHARGLIEHDTNLGGEQVFGESGGFPLVQCRETTPFANDVFQQPILVAV